MKSISLSDETKATFDTIQLEISSLQGRIVSQDEAIQELIKTYNAQKVK